MRYLFLCLFFFKVTIGFCQSFYFPKQAINDSGELSRSMTNLSQQVLAHYQKFSSKITPDRLYRLQIVAKQYEEALQSMEAYNKTQTDPVWSASRNITTKLYTLVKLEQEREALLPEQAYSKAFERLSQTTAEVILDPGTAYFSRDPKTSKITLDQQLQNRKSSDSINVAEAEGLCSAYSSYITNASVYQYGQSPAASYIKKKYIIEDSLLITTRDGAKLSAVVVRKRDVKVKQPAIFRFNIYPGTFDYYSGIRSAIQGYVGVTVHTRGKHLSPNDIEPFEHDALDAYDAIEWISKQPWSNNKVGMFGGSYLGFAQWAAAKTMHPALKTIVPQAAVGIGIDFPFFNNIISLACLSWLRYATNNKQTDDAELNNRVYWNNFYKNWYTGLYRFRSLDSLDKRPSKIFQRWLQHPSYDSYWQRMAPYQTDFKRINIPVLTITGYYDDDQRGAMHYYQQHHLFNKNANHYLVIGPYDHGGAQNVPSTTWRGYTLDSVANISINNLVYEWFDFILKGGAKPKLLKDKVNYQVMGTNQWKHAPSLAKMNSDTLTFYLSDAKSDSFNTLSLDRPKQTSFINQHIDLSDRSNSAITGASGAFLSKLDTTNAVIFVSSPLKQTLEINGSFITQLQTVINKKDMDIAIGLYECLPDGRYFFLSFQIGRASYAKDRSNRQLLSPNTLATLPITNTYFVSKQLQKGSRLAMVLHVNKNPYYQINYGTGKDVSDETITDAGEPLSIKWLTSSWIKIPVFLSK